MNGQPGIVFLGLARDCAPYLPRLLGWIEDFAAGLEDWAYVFLENDSHDDTASLLRAFDEKHRRGIVETLPALEQKLKLRTERLAWLRNRALDHVWNDPRLSALPFALILDMDEMIGVFPKHRLQQHIADWPASHAALFANRTRCYYDVWALRHAERSPDDCWARVRQRPRWMPEFVAVYLFVRMRQKPWPPGARFIEVESAFGGLGLYRLALIEGCRYRGLDGEGREVCEHVAFHRQIRAKGLKLAIDTAMYTDS